MTMLDCQVNLSNIESNPNNKMIFPKSTLVKHIIPLRYYCILFTYYESVVLNVFDILTNKITSFIDLSCHTLPA